jgi:adenylate kinase
MQKPVRRIIPEGLGMRFEIAQMVNRVRTEYEARLCKLPEAEASELRREMEADIKRRRKSIVERHMRIASKFGRIVR